MFLTLALLFKTEWKFAFHILPGQVFFNPDV